ncbi:PucR family transcriptional regulator [Rathayibacter sp. VKM Ac-2856]|uniref:helix-turn-helix domain-containing protein n=1 Tax=unclassified Rathayibacter TaxID=2609250 RepID=UPI00156487C7|nr:MULTISPECIES: PucR family transcriptional regulator [unclassified Rathayibacter]NQX05461.1 PucR family transcriptional regulator [Rathayibacter sp. VKM Ac-2858]NQX20664.1 PucR family transcriptional regulator [Rathayibacter sp. VKM Ac-2856]
MVIPLSEALLDPLLAAARPVIVAGGATAGRVPIRWAHASEQLDVAPLLLGGELLLMEGVNLHSDQDPQECRRYVESLVKAGIGALAVELSDRLPSVPAPLVAAADEHGLAVLALPHRVPFVQVCESINTRLTEQKFRSLRVADRLSGLLGEAAASDAGIDELLQVVASATGATAALVSPAGEEIVRADPGRGVDTSRTAGSSSGVLRAGDSLLGTLFLRAHDEADLHAVAVALDRAPDVLAIALLRRRPPTSRERLAAQLFAVATAPAVRPDPSAELQIDALLGRLGVEDRECFLGVWADVGDDERTLRSVRSALAVAAPAGPARGPAPAAAESVVCVAGGELLALLAFPDAAARERARGLLLGEWPSGAGTAALVCVGSGADACARVPRELAEVRGVREWTRVASGVVDARLHRLERFASTLRDDAEADALVEEVLGPLRHGRPELLATLEAFASHWGGKTATAAALGIGRQTLYDRLARIEALIGPLDASPARTRVLLTAVSLHRARAALPPAAPRSTRPFPPPPER